MIIKYRSKNKEYKNVETLRRKLCIDWKLYFNNIVFWLDKSIKFTFMNIFTNDIMCSLYQRKISIKCLS